MSDPDQLRADRHATDQPPTKHEWRATLTAGRRARTADQIAHARRAIGDHLRLSLLTQARSQKVFVYLPLPTEPLDPTLPDALLHAGIAVFAPVAQPGEPLDWCRLLPMTQPITHPAPPHARGMLGVPEPTGDRLGPEAIRSADVILVPALAVDATGTRLGRGGGHYDRSLALLTDPRPRLIAVLFDDELLTDPATTLPRRQHDIRLDEVVTPTAGVQRLQAPGKITPSNLANPHPDGALSD